eukprot:scaffold29359_cov79-Isochrysis_galbana.AAC.2
MARGEGRPWRIALAAPSTAASSVHIRPSTAGGAYGLRRVRRARPGPRRIASPLPLSAHVPRRFAGPLGQPRRGTRARTELLVIKALADDSVQRVRARRLVQHRVRLLLLQADWLRHVDVRLGRNLGVRQRIGQPVDGVRCRVVLLGTDARLGRTRLGRTRLRHRCRHVGRGSPAHRPGTRPGHSRHLKKKTAAPLHRGGERRAR